MKNSKFLPISIVIPTLGEKELHKCLKKLSLGNKYPRETLIIIPKDYVNLVLNYSTLFKKLNTKIIVSNKKNQVYQRILGFKKAKNKFVFQLDGDVYLEKYCLEILFNFIKNKKKVAVAPRYLNNEKLSNIYKYPTNIITKLYHWLINSHSGYSPGKISLSGFNYSDERKKKGFNQNDWLSGGAVMHRKNNLVLKNYYPYNFKKKYCEDILHSLILRRKNIELIKIYEAKASSRQSGVITNQNLILILKDFKCEFLIRKYIVKSFNFSQIRLFIYYFILILRIIYRKSKW